MARKALFNIAEADTRRAVQELSSEKAEAEPANNRAERQASRRQEYREGKRAGDVLPPRGGVFQMHVLLARQGRKKVQHLMEELVDDWFRRENAPRLIK